MKLGCSQNSTCTGRIGDEKAWPPDHKAPHPTGAGETHERGSIAGGEQKEGQSLIQQESINPQTFLMTLFPNSPYRVVKNNLNKKIIQKDERLPDGDSILVNICFIQINSIRLAGHLKCCAR